MKKYPRRSNAVSLLALMLVLAACGVTRPAASQALAAEKGAYQLEVLVGGVPVRTFTHQGETHVLGHAGDRYVLRVHNRSGRRVEAVVSVDGLDVIDGQPADFADKRGYLIPAYGHVDIDGWRISAAEAAAFRFGAVSDSYAAKTSGARNVGVIGVAVFPERVVAAPPPRVVAPRFERAEPSSEWGPESRAPEAPAKGRGGATGGAASRGEPDMMPAAPALEAEAKVSSGAAADARRERRDEARPGLGTEFGEAVTSRIEHVSFVRANPRRPACIVGARYNDRDGLVALGIDVDGRTDRSLRRTAHPFPMSSYARPPADWRRF